jgi:two-component system CheB/CheR fusion protein
MQSSNEELATLNDELQTRNNELAQSNNDLLNLLASVQMAIVVLGVGPDFRIRRFTPMAERMLNLIATDVGRPITDIRLSVDVPDLDEILRDVLDTAQAYQCEGRALVLAADPSLPHAGAPHRGGGDRARGHRLHQEGRTTAHHL